MQKFIQSYTTTKFNNNFTPALICFLLRNVDNPDILEIRQKICSDLIAKKKDPIVWNYDDSGRYPDDLDDTFSALIAIHFTQPEFLTGENFIKITNLLGDAGPYQTWLYSEWHDLDVVVNSTIAYFLSLYKINLPPLTEYIDNSFDSKYYTNPLVKYYFISRGYAGTKKEEIISIVSNMKPKTLLETALRFSTLMNLGEKVDVVFEDLPMGNDLYIDKDGYEGCDALTYAFCLEALSLVKKEKPPLVLNTLLPRNIRFNDIFKTASKFDRATALGWIAYSLYDDVVDNDAPVETIYEANEIMVDLILSLKHPPDLIKKIFTRMHKATIWELQNCRSLDKLPRFKKHYSGEKSLGFVFDCPVFPTSRIINKYREFLELKQLNDDAHDWKEDLDRGHITHANIGVARYMKKGGTDIENYYWNKNIVGIIARYKMHIRRLKGFEYLKEDIEKMYRILLTLERERDYFLHKYKS